MATFAQLLAAGVKWINASDKAHAIVNGPASGVGSEVTVESGVLPTFAKVLADNVQSALSGVGVPVNPGSSLTISGGAPSTVNGNYTRGTDEQGKPSYFKDNNYLGWIPTSGGYWNLSPSPLSGGWGAKSTSNVATPDLATGWVRSDTLAAVPGLTITLDAGTPASFIGQLYLDTSTSIWYRWTGTTWDEDAGSGGLYAFEINEDGHLILTYADGTPPDFVIDGDGHLIYTF